MTSSRTITERIEAIELSIQFSYNEAGDITIERNYLSCDPYATDLWELESPDVRRQVESAASTDLARDGRL